MIAPFDTRSKVWPEGLPTASTLGEWYAEMSWRHPLILQLSVPVSAVWATTVVLVTWGDL